MNDNIVIDFEALHNIFLLSHFRASGHVSVDHRSYGPIHENATPPAYRSDLVLSSKFQPRIQTETTSIYVDAVDTGSSVARRLDYTPTNAPQTQPPLVSVPAQVVSELSVSSMPVTEPLTESVPTHAMIRLFDEPAYWLGDLFVVDLNQDGVDELLVAGRKSQPSSATEWQDTYVSILGWNTGSWQNENDIWFQDLDSKIMGTEPSVRFADFDNNGYPDIWIAPSADMPYYAPGTVYFNDGDILSRQDLDIDNIWAHDSVVADFNNDGLDDIFVSSYGPNQAFVFAQQDGSFKIDLSSSHVAYAGIAAGDFLGDGTVSLVLVDAPGDSVSDTVLYALTEPSLYTGLSSEDLTNTSHGIALHSILPGDRFGLPKWDFATWLDQSGHRPHSVRATAMDFNRDGLDDVVVYTSAIGANGDWHRYFEVQFLQNQGSGLFSDQTETIVMDWDSETTVSYNPRLIDFNGDGLDDIWLGAQDYNGTENSNRVLIAQSDGTFRSEFQEHLGDLRAAVGGYPSTVAWLQGPDRDYFASLNWSPDDEHAMVQLTGAVDL